MKFNFEDMVFAKIEETTGKKCYYQGQISLALIDEAISIEEQIQQDKIKEAHKIQITIECETKMDIRVTSKKLPKHVFNPIIRLCGDIYGAVIRWEKIEVVDGTLMCVAKITGEPKNEPWIYVTVYKGPMEYWKTVEKTVNENKVTLSFTKF